MCLFLSFAGADEVDDGTIPVVKIPRITFYEPRVRRNEFVPYYDYKFPSTNNKHKGLCDRVPRRLTRHCNKLGR